MIENLLCNWISAINDQNLINDINEINYLRFDCSKESSAFNNTAHSNTGIKSTLL